MKKLFWLIYIQPLHRIVIWMIAAVLLWGYIGKRSRDKLWWRTINFTVFAGIVLVIVYMTICTREPGAKKAILIPFHSFIEAKAQPEMYRSMLMNVFLFVPLGLSLPFVIPKDKFPVVVTLVLAFLYSACIETIQYCYGFGRCEADDIIMNILGASIGTLSYVLSQPAKNENRVSR